MKLNDLIDILNLQNKNLTDLLTVVGEKQYALVHAENNNLNQCLNKEEKLLLKIQSTEENRLQMMKTIFQYFQINNERFKLSILAEALAGKVNKNTLDVINRLEKEMKSKISQIAKINQQNMMLIQQSRQLINDTIQAVVNLSNRSIVDRKG